MVDIALVEGAVSSRSKTSTKIQPYPQAHSKLLVAMGDCAVTGNVPAMRNPIGPLPILQRAYIENATIQPQIPCDGRARTARQGAPHSRVREGGRVSARLSALRRHLLHRAAATCSPGTQLGYPSPHPFRRLTGESMMSQTITIDPVTRLEGHGKITIQLNDQGEV